MPIALTDARACAATIEGASLCDIAAGHTEAGPHAELKLSRDDVLQYFAIEDPSTYTQQHHETLIAKIIADPEQHAGAFFLSDASPTVHNMPKRFSATDLSSHTQCLLRAHHKATDRAGFSVELEARAQRNAAQLHDHGTYVFHRYTYKRVPGKYAEQPRFSDALELLQAIRSDRDRARRNTVAEHLMAQGCADIREAAACMTPNAVMWARAYEKAPSCALAQGTQGLPCYENALQAVAPHYPILPVNDGDLAAHAKINTYSAFARSLRNLKLLIDPAQPLPTTIQRVLIIGAGWEVVPDTFDLPAPSQTTEPLVVMNLLVGAGIAMNDVTIDVVDINPQVVRHIQRAQHSNAPYPLHLFWRSDETAATTIPFAEHLSQTQPRELLAARVRTEWACGGGTCDPYDGMEIQERVSLAPNVWSNVRAYQGDVTTDDLQALGSYDLAIMLHVHHYLNEVEKGIARDNITAALKPGGLLLSDDNGGYHVDCRSYPDAPLTRIRKRWGITTKLWQKHNNMP